MANSGRGGGRPRAADALPSGWFVLRTPLLPVDDYLAWSEGLEAPAAAADPERLEDAWLRDRERLRARLRKLLQRPEVREALFVASPSLDESFDVWLADPESERGQRIERSLVRYFSRMTWRSTPFGLFAGCSLGAVADRTALTLQPRDSYRRHARLDMDYVSRLIDTLMRDGALRACVTYRPNSSIYRAADDFRYVEGRVVNGDRQYWTVSASASAPLESTLARAKDGATLESLAAALVADNPEVELAEAEEFIGELIDSQLLVPELAPSVTGPEPLGALIAQLREYGAPAAGRLAETETALAALDDAPLGADTARYRHVAELLEPLPVKVDPRQLLQVDMVVPAREAVIGPAIIREIRESIDVVQRLSRRWDALRAFRDAFLRRYDQREVPLVEALDDVTGIGLPLNDGGQMAEEASPLLEGIGFPVRSSETVTWGARETLLLKRLMEAQQQRARELVLGMKELEAIQSEAPDPLAEAFSTIVTIVPDSADGSSLDGGNVRILLHKCASSSGAEPYGRFCHAHGELCHAVREHLRAEEAHRPDAIHAEIVHMPQGRLGNILLRPLLRDYEIPYLGRSGAPESMQIPVTDLLVSVKGSRIVVRSETLGKEVLPRMTNAHGFNGPTSLGLYRFLCMLRFQGRSPLDFDWGPLAYAPYLPRLVIGRTVLSRAQWRVPPEKVQAIAAARGADAYRLVQELRRELDLPRRILLADADRRLPVDLDNALSVDMFAHLAGRSAEVVLMEMYPAPEAAVVQGPEGRFTHEISIPFVRPLAAPSRPEPALRVPRRTSVERTFLPGSGWLFAKLYGGTENIDRVLRELGPVVRDVLASGAAARWFFIRYGDPDWHLRLRFQGDPERLQREVLPALHAAAAPMLGDGRIWRMGLDTYEREIERYGGAEGIVLSEQLFQIDSEAVLAILEMLVGDEGMDTRWRLALRGIDLLLGDLGLDTPAKLELLRRQRESYAKEFRADRATERQLSEKYRKERAALERLFDPPDDDDSDLAAGLRILEHRSARLRGIAGRLRTAAETGSVTVPISDLAASYVHMHANRLLRSAQRQQELILYDFLLRHYESVSARGVVEKGVASGITG